MIDAKIVFPVNDRGYINPRIVVEAGKEQILSYEEPKEFSPEGEEITGWATKAPEPLAEDKQDVEVESDGNSQSNDYSSNSPIPEIGDVDDQLPF